MGHEHDPRVQEVIRGPSACPYRGHANRKLNGESWFCTEAQGPLCIEPVALA